MICQKCGAQLNDDVRFCTACGAPVDLQQAPPEQHIDQDPTSFREPPMPGVVPQNTAPAKKKGCGGLVIGLLIGLIAVVIVAVVIGVAAFFLGQNTAKKTSLASDINASDVYAESTTDTAVQDSTSPDTSNYVNPNLVSPDFYYETEFYYVEPAEGINLRLGPGTEYERICGIPKGNAIEIVGGSKFDPDREWVYVYYEGKSVYGWVSAEYISFDHEPADPTNVSPNSIYYYSEHETYHAYVTPSAGLNVRSGPGTDFEKTGSMRQGEIFLVLGVSEYDNNWVYIKYEENSYGFVHSEYINVY